MMNKIAVLNRMLGAAIGLIGLTLLAGGIWLLMLGGSPYYLLAGVAYVVAAILLIRLHPQAAWWVAAVTLVTIPWALWERATDYWELFPRLLMPLALAAAALLSAAPLLSQQRRLLMRAAGALMLVATLVQFALAFVIHGDIKSTDHRAFNLANVDNAPSDWSAYGRTTAGTRYAPFNQINRGNVGRLAVAWQVHDGDAGPGVRQNIPLQIGDTLYACSPNDRVTAIDADTGSVRWKHDSKASAPSWQRCRGLGYYAMPRSTEGAAPVPCATRIFNSTIDARLIALDAQTGQPCQGFGKQGEVDLRAGMGEVPRGFYYQTAAPTVARDYVIIGGIVMDNQRTGEPSGVIRAFDARTGAFVWAWDMGNPASNAEPPPGKSYTRATPNMWTTAAYDDRLGLVYVPLGNETPDYFGGSRMPVSDAYNSSIVALDVLTGRERWKVQTVHHDVWDYDLPAQPALVDVPDGAGHTVPALLQATKRGQLFLVNRETGGSLAEVQERPVTQKGAVPGEQLSPTQPYSVGMPTIGADRLEEKKMWGATMLDQLWCRISFLQHNYYGDFTPPGLRPSLEQPGNAGGFNWGSVSYDPVNHLAFLNDIRIPSEFWLIPRSEYPTWYKAHPWPTRDGHGPAAMLGLPYGEATYLWVSPIGVPCTEPPFGTITAIDLATRKVAWQIPAGTAQKLGPFGIASHMPMPIGMPTYAGTMTTAGGLVFFSGFQDYYLRAYDAQTGKQLWEYPLPVGSSATPMSYVSPKTRRQYIVVSVGGAAHSEDSSDLIIAFSLPSAGDRNGPPK